MHGNHSEHGLEPLDRLERAAKLGDVLAVFGDELRREDIRPERVPLSEADSAPCGSTRAWYGKGAGSLHSRQHTEYT